MAQQDAATAEASLMQPSIQHMKQIDELQTIAEWEEYTQEIPKQGLLIFKFSPRCFISRSVERGFDVWCENLVEETAPRCVKVNVVGARELSQHLAKELNVRHESPQAIWLTPDRQVHWHASHRAINSRALNTQLDTLTGL